MFRGQFEHSIDAKGRTSLPAKFREIIATRGSDRLVVTTDVESCLLAFPVDEWQQFEQKLMALPAMDSRVRMVKRFLIGSAHEVQVDGNGRILIPPALREHAGLSKDVIFAGQLDRIEIWNKHGWNQARSAASNEAMQAALNDLGI